MRVQVRTLQVPRRGAGAFLPGLTPIPSAATAGEVQAGVYGCPGTMPIPSPRPAALDDSSLGGRANQPSACAPNWFLPSIYYAKPAFQFARKLGLWKDNVLPVPAQQPGYVASNWQRAPRIGGRVATSSVRPFTTWPTYGNQG